jgi:hypothetical protein
MGGTAAETISPEARALASLGPTVSAKDLRSHVEFLASDALNGRFPGTEGIRRAERYIADAFDQAGLTTSAQEFTVFEHGFDPQGTRFAVHASGAAQTSGADQTSGAARAGDSMGTAGRELVAELNQDFIPFWFTGTGALQTEMVFAGYGITAPEHDYDDYAGLDVDGKLVFIFRHEPNEADPDSPFNGDAYSRHAYFATKAENAHAHGAAGMVLVTDPVNHNEDDFLILPSMSQTEEPRPAGRRNQPDLPEDFLAVHISQAFAGRLAEDWTLSLAEIQRRLDAGGSPAQLEVPSTEVSLAVATQDEPTTIRARNIYGIRTTSETAPWVVIGAHHDHLGRGPGSADTIYNGADDNASGVAAVLELASELRDIDDRNLLFVTFSVEEQGLFGSHHFVENSPVPLEDIALMINFDMIGRNSDEKLVVYAGRSSSENFQLLTEIVRDRTPPVELRRGRIQAYSDHFPFYDEGIPVLSFFTGTHEDYHQPTDSAEKLDYARMESILSIATAIVRAMPTTDSVQARAS